MTFFGAANVPALPVADTHPDTYAVCECCLLSRL